MPKIDINPVFGYAAVVDNIGPTKPVAYIGLRMIGDMLMARNAYTEPSYQQKSIVSELFLFVNQIEGYKILSDSELSRNGEALWLSMIKSGKFSTKIYYMPTKELFDLSDIGKQTSDGLDIISPKNDFVDSESYDSKTKIGQRFFYLLENHSITFVYEENGYVYKHGIDRSKHRSKSILVQPYRHFKTDVY